MMVSSSLASLISNVLVFSGMGLAIFGLSFVAMLKLAPFSLRKEIEEDQNVALAVIIGSVVLGLAIIVASVVRG
jgi:putative membrane protein